MSSSEGNLQLSVPEDDLVMQTQGGEEEGCKINPITPPNIQQTIRNAVPLKAKGGKSAFNGFIESKLTW